MSEPPAARRAWPKRRVVAYWLVALSIACAVIYRLLVAAFTRVSFIDEGAAALVLTLVTGAGIAVFGLAGLVVELTVLATERTRRTVIAAALALVLVVAAWLVGSLH